MTDFTAFTVTIWWDTNHPKFAMVSESAEVEGRVTDFLATDWPVIHRTALVRDDYQHPGKDVYLLGVHWLRSSPDWPVVYWPLAVAEELHSFVRRWDAVTDVTVVGHEDTTPEVTLVDAEGVERSLSEDQLLMLADLLGAAGGASQTGGDPDAAMEAVAARWKEEM